MNEIVTTAFGKIVSAVLAAVMTVAAGAGCTDDKPAVDDAFRDISTVELVQDMGVGINLGNTFEACGDWINGSSVTNYETAWGSPVVTKEMINGYAAEGFGVLRIPVAWSNMMDENDNYTIAPEYIDRVKEVVDWTLDSGMYAIVNIHWDGGWFDKFPTEKTACMKKYVRVWEQVCAAFSEYGDKLVFESLNEEGGWNSLWNKYGGSTDGKSDSFGLLNEINQTFVDTVRNSGGGNEKRHLLIAGYNTDIELTCDRLYRMPDDPAGRCAVSVHYYTPATFCILTEDADWGKAQTEWGSDAERAELDKLMDKMKTNFVDKGIPVIIGEYGAAASNKKPREVREYLSAVCSAAYSRGMCPVLWDTPGGFYDREKCAFSDKALVKQLMSVKEQ